MLRKILNKMLNYGPSDPDALQKLKLAQAQQRVEYLRNQIRQKMSDMLWREAKTLVTEGVEIAPDDATLTRWEENIDEQLYLIEILGQAKEAKKKGDWPQVIALYREALELEPDHAEALRLLDQAKTQYRIVKLRHRIDILLERGNHKGALEKLKSLLILDATNVELKIEINQLQKTIDLKTYFDQGKRAYDQERWEEAVKALEKALAIDHFYHKGRYSAAYLKVDAEKKLAQEKVQKQMKKQQILGLIFNRLSGSILTGLEKFWKLITHNAITKFISLIIGLLPILIALLTIPAVWNWFTGLFVPPSIEKFEISIDGRKVEEGSIGHETVNLTELPHLVGNIIVKLKIDVIDSNGIKYTGDNNLKCNWTVAPIDNEEEGINTESCEALYIPSQQSQPKQKVVVSIEGVKQKFKPVPPISMEFEITNN